MRARYWFNTAEDPDRRRRRMAEFLVYQSLPLESVAGVVVYDRDAESHVAAVLRAAGSALPLAIRRAWYF
jgi:uncharacterized membrane protein